jgi:hypothetical protein
VPDQLYGDSTSQVFVNVEPLAVLLTRDVPHVGQDLLPVGRR